MTMERSFVQRNFHYFLFVLYFLTFANFAFFTLFNYLSFSFTSITIFLNLLIHSRAHLIHLHYSTFSFACFTRFYFRTAFSLTSLATSNSLMRNFDHFSSVTLLQSNLQSFLDRFSFWFLSGTSSSSTTSATEKHI